ncbi:MULTISPECIES: DNA polymerase III subunit beta [Candidatus Methylopumilus]|jgi:DNA polymerase-3 subunit beta|uniref:DNA polymerase III subunit beta n=1 Tax=Candidatus Methylopumilus TaxID=1679002 RepID=UPI00111F8AA6|nr:DNA polymerase III subunit beta [Candidatus Methylopumilus universalis]QDC69987.1 DNA polymerase III subunit beta [Candidatus Methylopumilus universalis]
MNIKINRDALLKPLANVASIVERKHALPILSNILIQGKDGQVQLTATDLEMQVSLSFKADLKEEIATTISARKFFDITRSLPDDCVIDIAIKDSRVSVKANKSRFAIQTLPAKDYPVMTKASSEAVVITISQIQLKRLLKQVEFAMAQQDIRYYLNGLLFEVNGNQLNIVGTDGHRLSFTSIHLDQNYNKTEVILPRKTVIELIKLLNETEELVSVELYKGQVSFNFNDIQLISKVIDGKFPDYTRVIPEGHNNQFTIDRSQFLTSLQRASILSNEKYRGIRMMIADNNLKLISTNTEQEEAEEELEIQYQQDPIDIGFNVTYLIDVLTNIQEDKVTLAFLDTNSSCLFTIPNNNDYKYVVMPMRI